MRDANRAFLERAQDEELIDPHDQHSAWSQASLESLVGSLDPSSITLSTDVARFAGEAEADQLQAILHEVWELNQRFAGEPQLEAFVQINGSPEQRDLIDRSLAWARPYVFRRLARPSPRDRGCAYRRFLRLWGELVHFVDQIGIAEVAPGRTESTSVIGQYLAPMCDFITWSFFEGTWISDVTWSDEARPAIRERPDVDLATRARCFQAFGVYQWKKARVFDRLLREMAATLASVATPHAQAAEERERIDLMAEDIAEMRPFLVRNFPRSKATVELPGGWIARFGWNTLHQIVRLHVARSARELIEADERGVADLVLSIGAEGLLRCSVCPWRSVATYEAALPFPPLAIGRIVLEAVHAKLFTFYGRVDVAGILARWRAAEEQTPERETEAPAFGPASAEDETQVIAASIALGAGVLGEERRPGRVSSSLRLSVLRSLLERGFGCEARSSKGSELVFYRPGGRHAFVARHVSNPLIPAIAIQRMLKKLGISIADWVQEVGRGK